MSSKPLGELITPAPVRRALDVNYPLLSMTMHEGLVDQSSKFKKRVASADVSEYKVVKRGQLVVGFPIDEGVLDFQSQYDAGIVSPAYAVWDLRDAGVIDRHYLKLFLRSPRAMAYYKAKLRGSTARRRSLPSEVFLALDIPVPPLAEQRRIAAILDQADELRANRRQVIACLASLSHSIFVDMFGKADAKRVPFQSIVTTMRNGISPSKVGTTVATVLTLSAVTHGSFDPFAVKASTFLEEPPPEMRVSARDFLICRGNGNRALVGVGVHPQQDRPDLVFPDTVIAARIDKEEIDPTYLQAAWEQPAVRRQIEAAARTTNGTHKVNQQSLGAIELLLPPLIEQREFARRVIAIPRPGLIELDELFISLQSRAFSGQL